MKNIFLLPTEEVSRLVKNNEGKLKLTIQTLSFDNIIGCYPQNLYITSNEEIKEGDWYLWQGYDGEYYKEKCKYLLYEGKKTKHLNCNIKTQFKVILTTDLKLIADGIQAIDDTFLEWFVKNPSCEFVKTELLNVSEVLWEEYFKKHGVYPKYPYYEKIIIPQEESKQEYCDNCNNDTCCCIIRSQEILEEAAKKYAKDKCDLFEFQCTHFSDFIAGAKSDAARDYWFKIFKEQFIVSSSGK
jgi:hypothetical protein